jgi:Na+/H+-dicarboxylate symporter
MEIAHQPTKKSRLTLYILIAMILGIVAGYFVHENYPAETIKVFSDNIKLLTTIFLRMVQMIIAPIVFATLVVGIARLGDMKTVGRVGGKAMLWFITASLVSLGLGLILVNIFKPGVGADITHTDMAAVNDLLEKSKGFSLQKFVEHVVPKSVIEAMANNETGCILCFFWRGINCHRQKRRTYC